MAEEGIDIAGEQPKILTTDAVKTSDVVITMGCGDTCPFYPGKRYEDWVLDDPAGPLAERQTTLLVHFIRDIAPLSLGIANVLLQWPLLLAVAGLPQLAAAFYLATRPESEG